MVVDTPREGVDYPRPLPFGWVLIRWEADWAGNVFGERVFRGFQVLVESNNLHLIRDKPIGVLPKYDEDGNPIEYIY